MYRFTGFLRVLLTELKLLFVQTEPLKRGKLSDEMGNKLKEITENIQQKPDSQNSTFEDKRYFGAQQANPLFFKKVLQSVDQSTGGLIEKRYGNTFDYFVLYNEITGQGNSMGSGGGWHRDSFIHQYKVIIYLTDVNDRGDGAFEFAPGTSKGIVRLVDYIKRWWKKSITRYSEISNSEPIFGEKYTYFLINTSAIHRGSPLLNGNTRKAVTFYLYDKIPSKFIAYL